jgi:hypothetical protein
MIATVRIAIAQCFLMAPWLLSTSSCQRLKLLLMAHRTPSLRTGASHR